MFCGALESPGEGVSSSGVDQWPIKRSRDAGSVTTLAAWVMRGSPGVSRPINNCWVTTPRSDFWPFPDQLQWRDRAGFSPASKRRSRAFYVRKNPWQDKISEAGWMLARRLFRAWRWPERLHRRSRFTHLAQARSSPWRYVPEDGGWETCTMLKRQGYAKCNVILLH